jgi:CheY-like chemotaxis protein
MENYSDTGILNDRRIFMVEDNLENRVIMKIMLERHGARVEFERWGRDTLHKLETFAPVDVILLDLMLPNGMSGFDVFDKIRSVPQYSHVPIVAVSASDTATSMPKAQARGFNGYIAKPIDYDLFPKQIARIINHEMVWLA